MGRKVSALSDDGRPLTSFAQGLRALREQANAPTLKELAKRAGYAQPRLSELFNAKKMPSDDLLRDVVQALEGDAEAWLMRLKDLRVAEEEHQASSLRRGDTTGARIARLEHENKRLLALTCHPDSVIAQAKVADEAAAARMDAASALETQARMLLTQATDQFRQAHERMPAVQRQADSLIADARATADRCVLQGRIEQERIIQEANDRAEAITRKGQQEASALKQRAIEYAKEHRSKAATSVDRMLEEVDQLRAEAEQAVKQAQTQRSTMERRAKVEIERLVREAQRSLDAAGAAEEAQTLEKLLLDFNISDSHTDVRGRHARRPPQPGQHASPPAGGGTIPPPMGGSVTSGAGQRRRPWGFPQPRG